MSSENTEDRLLSRHKLCFEQSTDHNEKCDTGDQSDSNNVNGGGMDLDKIHSFMSSEIIPAVNMQFDSEEKAWEFYSAYADQVGFCVRKSKSHTDKYGNLIARTFCCSAEGKREKDKRDVVVKIHRAETRCGCQARIRLHTRHTKKFHVIEFVKEHNHYLSRSMKTHQNVSRRKATSVKAANDVGIAPKAANDVGIAPKAASDVGIAPKAENEVLASQAVRRENTGFIPEDYKNCLRSKRTRDVKTGDIGGVLEYLHKMQFQDPNFFYAIQVDEDDLITNIFWSDAKMRTDFSNFGDVVCFDTTYHKNNDGRPIALFVGVNHHKQMVIFGAALLYDETTLTYDWLFDTFSRAMSCEKPKTILTDQDAAMADALSSRWPETNHRLCVWHIYQNAANHLRNVLGNSESFFHDFSRCIYDIEEENEFIIEWDKMLQKHGLINNQWLKHIFRIRDKWALVYGREMFCADMANTQRSESMNSFLKRYVNYKYKFLDFFNHYESFIEDRRYKELKADFKANVSFPALQYPCEILRNAASVYTPEVFECFEKEWCKSLDSSFRDCGEVGLSRKYEITPFGKQYHHTVLSESLNKFKCTCKKFEFCGILCSHILKVFNIQTVLKIPSEYILKRWTRRAKTGYSAVEDSFESKSDLDPKLLFGMRYKELCRLYIQLVTKAAETDETHDIAKDGMLKMLEAVDTRLHVTESTDRVSKEKRIDLNGNTMLIDDVSERAGKRLKGDLERASQMEKQTYNGLAKSMASMPMASCAESVEENPHANPFIPVTEYQMPNDHGQMRQAVTQRDVTNLVNPTPLQSNWCAHLSQPTMEDNRHAAPFIPVTENQLPNYHEVEPQRDTTNLFKPILQQSDRCAQSSQSQHSQTINMPDGIDVSARTTVIDSHAAIVGVCRSPDCSCPVPCEVGRCKKIQPKNGCADLEYLDSCNLLF